MPQRAAIVIGVDKTGGLRPLKSASICAREVADWLGAEGYDVECLTDESEPVTSQHVSDAIDRFVTLPPRYHQLVVYFTGHGYWHARADIWLLSKAPMRTQEGVNLDGAIYLAKYSGIPNVIFVSDACRSIPDTRTGALMKGIDAFPNFGDIDTPSKIDVFRATADADLAYEATIDGRPRSLLTHALLSAYVEPTAEMVRELSVNGTTLSIVPNRRLEDYLQAKVDTTLAGIDINLIQKIEASVPSQDDVYIAAVRRTDGDRTAVRTPRGPLPPSSVERDAASSIGRILSQSGLAYGSDLSAMDYEAPETSGRVESLLPRSEVDHFESEIGFAVSGGRIASAFCAPGQSGANIELLERGDGDGQPGVLRVWDAVPGASVLIRMEGGRGAVVAALKGYIGHVVYQADGVSNVSYIPSANHERYVAYQQKRERLDRLRALVALAAEHNVFWLNSVREARSLGNEIRVEKALDPTLGLYAAHAFAQASEMERIDSIRHYMRDDIDADLFDVRVLSTRRGWDTDDWPVLPFCPLLTQTWNLLRPKGIDLGHVLTEASGYLCNALWTTFEPAGAELLQQAIEQGELT
jgi:hypothetical protein